MDTSPKKRILWLDNTKLIACVAVFWGHYYNAFYGQLSDTSFLTAADNAFIFAVRHVLSILFDGAWWVFVFCIISGWLAWQKRVDSLKSLIHVIARRYLRFAIPVLAANIVVVIVGNTIGFHSYDVGNAINNPWLAQAYEFPPGIGDVVKSAALLNNEYIGPLWVLKYIFAGTCIIYCMKYISDKMRIDNRSLSMLMVAIWPVLYYLSHNDPFGWYYVAVTMGGCLLKSPVPVEKEDDRILDKVSLLGLLIIMLSLDKWDFDQLWNFITAELFLWFSFNSQSWQKWMESSKAINSIQHLSFSIYLLHGAVLFSATMLIFSFFQNNGLSYFIAVTLNLIISTVIVIGVCEVYYRLVQKRIDALIRRI